jgi:hypothetical protein
LSPRAAFHDMLALLALLAALWLFHLYVRVLPTAALGVAWLMLALVVTVGLWRSSRVRRRGVLAVYIHPDSPWQHRLRGGLFMAAKAAGLGALLALVLLLGLARAVGPVTWILLIASVPALVGLRAWLARRMAPHAGAAYLPLASWRVAAWSVGSVLLLALVALSMFQVQPHFAGVSLERAVWHLVEQENARSPAAATLLQVVAGKDGLRLWLAQQLMPAPAASLAQLLGWMLVLATEALFVWSYLRAGHGVLVLAGAYDRAER